MYKALWYIQYLINRLPACSEGDHDPAAEE